MGKNTKTKLKMAMMKKMMKSGMKAMMRGMKKASMMRKMKKAMKAPKVAKGRGAKARVFKGKKEKTSGGLKKSDLVKSKSGKIVSKKASLRAKNSKNGKKIAKWGVSVKAARRSLGIKGFCPVGGKTAKGQQLLKAVRSLYRK